MAVFEWLQESMIRLRDAGVDSPRRDCLVLLEDLLEKHRAWVLAHHDFELSNSQLNELSQKLKRRINREPLAYIRGRAWFYGRFFHVNPDVLIPRPESEALIELAKTIKPKKIIDIGMGSGCLAITAKLELPEAEVIAVDNDPKAIEIAEASAKKYNSKIDFRSGDLLEKLSGDEIAESTLLVNLPYVPDGLITSPETNYEPKSALFSGKDGLDHYRKFWQATGKLSQKPKYVLTESLKSQHHEQRTLAKNAGYKHLKTEILVQLFETN